MVAQKPDRKDGIRLLIASLLMLLVIFLDLALQRSGIGNNIIALAPMNNFYSSLNRLGMADVSKSFYPLLFILFLVAVLGTRALGFVLLKRISRDNGEVNWLLVFLALFVLGGFVLSEMVYLGDPQGMNNAGWFSVQSLMGAWFLLFTVLVQSEHRWSRSYLVFFLIMAMAAPTTIQFLSLRYDPHYVLVDSDDLVIVDYLADVDPGAVVLHPLNKDRLALASNLAGKSSVLNILKSFVTEANQLSARATDVQLFFSVDASPIDRSSVLQKYGVNYVYGPLGFDRYLGQLHELKKIKSTDKWSLYQVKKQEVVP